MYRGLPGSEEGKNPTKRVNSSLWRLALSESVARGWDGEEGGVAGAGGWGAMAGHGDGAKAVLRWEGPPLTVLWPA